MAGAVPVPLYPPQTMARVDAYLANCRASSRCRAPVDRDRKRPLSIVEAAAGTDVASKMNGAASAMRAFFALPERSCG